MIKKGKRFSLGLNFDRHGPQKGSWGNRFNPIHLMLATGTDAVAGRFDDFGLRYADDMISLPLQCATQWDALAHIFYDDYELCLKNVFTMTRVICKMQQWLTI